MRHWYSIHYGKRWLWPLKFLLGSRFSCNSQHRQRNAEDPCTFTKYSDSWDQLPQNNDKWISKQRAWFLQHCNINDLALVQSLHTRTISYFHFLPNDQWRNLCLMSSIRGSWLVATGVSEQCGALAKQFLNGPSASGLDLASKPSSASAPSAALPLPPAIILRHRPSPSSIIAT